MLSAPRGALLERDELGRAGCTNTGATVLDRLVSDGELAQIVTNHIRLDFHLREVETVIHAHHGANHFWYDNHVAVVSLDRLRLLGVFGGSVLFFAQFPYEAHWDLTACKPPANARSH